MGSFPLGSPLTLSDLRWIATGSRRGALGRPARARMLKARRFVLERAAGGPLYGVNTGFGELATRKIAPSQTRTLQRNLLLSHAVGVGEPLGPAPSRAIVFLRANELARGHSGVRPLLVESMLGLLAKGLLPVIPSRGSVGASGDLAPQAHAALPLIGEGEVWRREKRAPARRALAAEGLSPIELDIKEGLSLINGTQAMQAVGGLALLEALDVLEAADAAGAMSLEALKGTPVPFDPDLHRLKPHPGQIAVAAGLRDALSDSDIRESHRVDDPRVQDPYSLRCMPQIHGAARDALEFARRTVETELNSVTDNPIVLESRGEVLSGGNFHGQALSFAFDFAAIALTALGNACERRVYQLVSDSTGILPPFLTRNPGLESGWMMAQVTAAALASENKTLAHPASADTIPTSGSKEDHVSMGMHAALKLQAVARNVQTLAAIELLAGAEGLDFHRPLKPGKGVRATYETLRSLVPERRGDRILSGDFETVRQAVERGSFRR